MLVVVITAKISLVPASTDLDREREYVLTFNTSFSDWASRGRLGMNMKQD